MNEEIEAIEYSKLLLEEQVNKGQIFVTGKPFTKYQKVYFSSNENIKDDDIIQIENEIYIVSESQYKVIRLPKPYKTYFCTLTRLKI